MLKKLNVCCYSYRVKKSILSYEQYAYFNSDCQHVAHVDLVQRSFFSSLPISLLQVGNSKIIYKNGISREIEKYLTSFYAQINNSLFFSDFLF